MLNALRLSSRSFPASFLALAACLAAAGCGTLPRATPTAGRIEASDKAREGEVSRLIVPLTVKVAAVSKGTGASGFPAAWQGLGTIDPARIGAGDVLEVKVWEPTDRPLIAGSAGGGGLIAAEVSRDGMVRLPFAPPVKAQGRTSEQLSGDIAAAMSAMSANAQTSVRIADPKSREVSVQGSVARAGVFPLESVTLRLSGILAEAGGTTADPAEVQVDVARGGKNYGVGLGELYSDPKLDIALRPGDRVVVRPIEDRYIILGASGGQAELSFQGNAFTLMQALARAGGLKDMDAAPDGIYLFRYETAETAAALLGPEPLPDFPVVKGKRPIVYRIDLSDPAALFAARSFRMRNGDTIVVTNAPLTELRKIASIFSSVTAPAQQVAYIGNE